MTMNLCNIWTELSWIVAWTSNKVKKPTFVANRRTKAAQIFLWCISSLFCKSGNTSVFADKKKVSCWALPGSPFLFKFKIFTKHKDQGVTHGPIYASYQLKFWQLSYNKFWKPQTTSFTVLITGGMVDKKNYVMSKVFISHINYLQKHG